MVDPTTTYDGLLVAAAGWLLVGCAAWAGLICTAVFVEAVSRGRWRATRWVGCPAPVRRLLLAGLGAALAGAGPAAATATPASGPPIDRSGATWTGLAVPARTVGHEPTGRLAVVRAGDTLWGIAGRRLGPRSSDAATAALVTLLHHRNAAVIGPDPDRIRPGQRLVLPPLDRSPEENP